MLSGGTLSTASFCSGSVSVSCSDTGSGVYDWREQDCNTPSDSDGGNMPLVAGKITGSGYCDENTGQCSSYGEVLDSCSGNTLTERTLSGDVTVDCSAYEGLWERSGGYSYNTSACSTDNGQGYCRVTQNDPDAGQQYCPAPLSWMDLDGSAGTTTDNCCGDDAGESFALEGNQKLCYSGSEKMCSGTTCESYTIGSTYYCAGGAWSSSQNAMDSCPGACSEAGGSWKEGTLKEGSKCCTSGNSGSVVRVDSEAMDYLCDGSQWAGASTAGTILLGFYLSDGGYWNKCTSPGTEKVVGSTTYLCTDTGWQNKECANQGDSYQTTCESCGGTWLGLGGDKNCCGDDSSDQFRINDTWFCQGVSGVVLCDQQCRRALEGSTAYFCFDGAWKQSSIFTGEVYLTSGDSAGCCQQGQCWDGQCRENGYVATGMLCNSGEWELCNETSLCRKVQTSAGTFYCTDDGWKVVSDGTCGQGRGLCINETCKLCGTDYQVGEWKNGKLCTASGLFSSSCTSDSDCPSSRECYTGVCINNKCEERPKACGATCDGGVCDGEGSCTPGYGEGAVCSCDAVCGTGLFCDGGSCARSELCGDGNCNTGECSACPQDCTIDECTGDGTCSTALGESCTNSEDCACLSGSYCDAASSYADAWGCVVAECGNNVCEKGECSTCADDCSLSDCEGNGSCDTLIGENCDNSEDCVCDVVVTTEEIPSLTLGEPDLMRVYFENRGNAPMSFDVVMISEDLDVKGGTGKITLGPNERQDIIVQVIPKKSGERRLSVLAKMGGKSEEIGTIEMRVQGGSVLDELYVWFKNSPFYKLYDTLSIAAFALSGIFFVFKLISPKKAVPNYYPGANYAGAYYRPANYQGYYRRY